MNECDTGRRWLSGGWLDGARRCPSPNRSERPPGERVELALIHSISLPPGRYGGDAIERLFTNQLDVDAHPYFERLRGLRVSSHFLLRRGGDLLQFVGCDERAWHAGPSRWREHADCNDFSVGIEFEGLEGLLFEATQYAGLISLLRALAERYPICGVAGHEHVAAGRKHDPGPGFDWARVESGLGWPAQYFPERVTRRA
jgi:AmpD protein